MQKYKKNILPILSLRGALFFCLVYAAHIHPLHAQMQQPLSNPSKTPRYYSAPYWEGFKLKHADKCEEALKKLVPLARQGHGFEDAQLAAGLCMLRLAGLTASSPTKKEKQELIKDANFRQGFDWILRAANAGHFRAQASLVSLYADDLAPPNSAMDATQDPSKGIYDTHVKGAMWAHLYLTNPLRLQIGAPIIDEAKLKKLENKMLKNKWLLGKELARNWIPVYDEQ